MVNFAGEDKETNMKKILMITCLSTSKEKYDGEYIKNTLIYETLKKKAAVDVISVSTHKIFNTLKIAWFALTKKNKYDLVIISKDPHGANIMHKIMKLVNFSMKKVIYFEIGPFLYNRILDGTIKKETFLGDGLIVVETNSMKNELLSLGFDDKRIEVFPNFKPVFDIGIIEKEYPKETLKLVYLSRIEEKKGIYELIDSLIDLNNKSIRFELDIYGRPQTNEEYERIKKLVNQFSFIKYKGKIDLITKDNYVVLSKYDLHVFPTLYPEGFPGTLIDFFIAGVPTLSSSFARANEILSDKDSVIFVQGDINDLKNKLLFIYENQNILTKLSHNTIAKKEYYSVEKFEEYLTNLLDRY